METVGIRELKAHLSRYLKRVRAGVRLAVTERGRTIATISPVEPPTDVDWAHQLVADGRARTLCRLHVGRPRSMRLLTLPPDPHCPVLHDRQRRRGVGVHNRAQ